MIYPGFHSHTHGLVTSVNCNYNSHKTLCSLIGKYHLSMTLKYIPSLGEELAEQLEEHADDILSYDYILYYDENAQSNKIHSEYNSLAPKFTNHTFWGFDH